MSNWTKKSGFTDLTKSGSDRLVEIAPPLVSLIDKILVENEDSIFLLPRIEDWDNGRQAEILRAFLVANGLPQISFHNLRATWATIMLSQGVPVAKVMELGGWASLNTLSQHYVRQTGIDIKGSTDTLDLE